MNGLTLAIDASTYTGTVALIRDGAVLAERSAAMRGEHEERLMPAVSDVLRDAGVAVRSLDAVACGAGPGSFTSLRIAASIAKGLATALGVPLLVAPSPLLIVAGAVPALAPGRYIAVLDAMRGDQFALDVAVEVDGGLVADGKPWLAPSDAVAARARERGATLVGPVQPGERVPHARGFASLLRQHIAVAVDLVSWEPDYGRKAEAQVKWERAHGRPLEAR
ncbi:MAG TPA: tRNA (adenosine(37)-N6)-threonylcarbamoyltransferase complex dimerization subunit type 1 TsaB [Gemmatimonadaceae bacterium]